MTNLIGRELTRRAIIAGVPTLAAVKDGERIEIDALRRRNTWLREVAGDKDCSIPPPTIVFDDELRTAAGPAE